MVQYSRKYLSRLFKHACDRANSVSRLGLIAGVGVWDEVVLIVV